MIGAHSLRVNIGPVWFDLRSPFPSIMQGLRDLYSDYPQGGADEIYDFAIEARPASRWRRWPRPPITFAADFTLENIVPVPFVHGVLGMEMAMNLQMALGYQRDLVLHAASAARDDDAVMMFGESGSGKSTLSALMGYVGGWRHLGDELALISFGADPRLTPYPRLIGLKEGSIPELERQVPAERFGPTFENTLKGTLRHLVPPKRAIETMHRTARPRLIISPHFSAGAEPSYRRMSQSELYMRLATASTNQMQAGEPGFDSFVSLVRTVPGYDMVYSDSASGLKLLDRLWAETA